MIESTFVVVVTVLVTACVLVLVHQARQGRREHPPVAVGWRTRALQVALLVAVPLSQAVLAARDGRPSGAALHLTLALAGLAGAAFWHHRSRPGGRGLGGRRSR